MYLEIDVLKWEYIYVTVGNETLPIKVMDIPHLNRVQVGFVDPSKRFRIRRSETVIPINKKRK